MRSILLIFGVLAGLVNVALVARYGVVTSDTAIDGGIAAFYFGIIVLGAIGGPAVAVHLVVRRRWVWGALFGLIAAVSLGANIVNSLGALAGRSDKVQAERTKARDDAKDDRAELKRVTAERAAMVFTPATEENAIAARDAVAAADAIRQRECGSGDPKQRGPKCRERETDEQTKRDALSTTLANKALTDKATRLDSDAAAIRARLDKAPPVQSVDPLAESISKLVNLPAEVAAAWQKASVVIVVELLIAFSLIGFELLGSEGRDEGKAEIATETKATSVREGNADNVLPMASPSTAIGRYMLARLTRAAGEQTPLRDVYSDLCRWCAVQAPTVTPPDVTTFGREFRALSKRAGIQTRTTGTTVYCLNVRLVNAVERVA